MFELSISGTHVRVIIAELTEQKSGDNAFGALSNIPAEYLCNSRGVNRTELQ
jgi:hypothetical protein